jgi:ribosomal protein S18 acetylase RimI-like enzyme
MTALTFSPFDDSLIDAAAELLAARHARDRARSPLLPARFSDPTAARAAVAAVWAASSANNVGHTSVAHTSGVAAWQGDALVGYLFGEVRIDTLRGRNVWVQLPGHALAADQPADRYADLYAAAGTRWLDWGAFDHYVMLPATDEAALQTWFGLSFGQEQAVAIRSLDDPLPADPDPPGIDLRPAGPDDAAQLIDELSPVLARHMTQAPVWGVALPEYAAPRRAGFAELLADDDVQIWAAFEDGRMLAYQIYMPVTPADDSLFAPENCALLELAATRPEARGRGIGRALAARGLADIRARGYTTCLLDWRTTNREARRFWLGRGFQPVAYRLVRRVDPRIAWAGGP